MTGELFFFSLTRRLFPEGEAGLEVLILSESTLGLGEWEVRRRRTWPDLI